MVRRVEGGRCGATDVREAWACRREAWACRARAGIRGPRVREGSWCKDGGSRMEVQGWGFKNGVQRRVTNRWPAGWDGESTGGVTARWGEAEAS